MSNAIQLFPYDGGSFPVIATDRVPSGQALAVTPVCNHVGLDPQMQARRIGRSPWSEGRTVIMTVQLPVADRAREYLFLDVERVGMWLATIDTGRVKDTEARGRIEAWQREAADVLWTYTSEGGVLNPGRTAAQNARLGEMIKYREARDLVTLADDYVAGTPATNGLFTRIQDRMLRCVTGQHAPELRSNREIVTWTGKRGPTKADRAVAKNYMTPNELTQLSGIGDIVVGTIKVEYPAAGYTVSELERRIYRVLREYELAGPAS